MRTAIIVSWLLCTAVGLPGCAADRSQRTADDTQRPLYSFENVDMRPDVSGEEYRDRDRAADRPNPHRDLR